PQPFHRELPAGIRFVGECVRQSFTFPVSGVHSADQEHSFPAKTLYPAGPQGLDCGRGMARTRPGPGEATMALPRVLFVRGGHLTAGAARIADGEWYAWRLIGRNNRELGRSAAIHPDVDACRADVIRLQAAGPRLNKFVVADLDQGLWRWRLESSGEVRA